MTSKLLLSRPLLLLMSLMMSASVAAVANEEAAEQPSSSSNLRGYYDHHYYNNNIQNQEQQLDQNGRSVKALFPANFYAQDSSTNSMILLSQPFSFQVVMSVLLGVIILMQITLLLNFIINRSKRVLEFAQPILICIFLCGGIFTTAACYLYIYLSELGCAI